MKHAGADLAADLSAKTVLQTTNGGGRWKVSSGIKLPLGKTPVYINGILCIPDTPLDSLRIYMFAVVDLAAAIVANVVHALHRRGANTRCP